MFLIVELNASTNMFYLLKHILLLILVIFKLKCNDLIFNEILVLYASNMCLLHSHFIENHPIWILEDELFISEVVLSQGIWHSWPFVHFHLERSLRPSKRRSFETKLISFQTKVFWNEAHILPDDGLLKQRLRPFGWRLSPMFWAFGTLGRFFVFIWNEVYVLLDEDLLNWSPHPSGWRSFEMKPTSFWMKVFWNEG
jgi:hypothetical protein